MQLVFRQLAQERAYKGSTKVLLSTSKPQNAINLDFSKYFKVLFYSIKIYT
tara:strand:- start:43 stop:195 length:153 start_codon:yes stop_codon:yes gene_type:complete